MQRRSLFLSNKKDTDITFTENTEKTPQRLQARSDWLIFSKGSHDLPTLKFVERAGEKK